MNKERKAKPSKKGRDVHRGIVLSQNMHHSVTTKMLVPDMFFRCDTRNIGKYSILTDIVFVREDAKRDRAPRWRWVVDGFLM